VFSALLVSYAIAQPLSLQEIRVLTEDGQYLEAVTAMNSFLATNPNDVEGKLYWGIILTRKGDVETAIKVFLELAEEHPTLAEPHNNLAVLYAAEGRYDEARQALITATKIRPEYDTAHENLGDLYTELAIIAYRTSHRSNHNNERALLKERRLVELVANEPHLPEDKALLTERPESELKSLCHRTTAFSDESVLIKAESWFARRRVASFRVEKTSRILSGYRVIVGGLTTSLRAKNIMISLQNQGLTDLLIVRNEDDGYSISLGVYGTSAAAQRRLAQIKTFGLSPTIELRYRDAKIWVLEIKNHVSSEELTVQFTNDFPGQSLRETACSSTVP